EGNRTAVRRELEAVAGVRCAADGERLLAGRNVPDLYESVMVCGGGQEAVRGEGGAGKRGWREPVAGEFLPRGNAPAPDRPVIADREERLAVGSKAERAGPEQGGARQPAQLLAGERVPESDALFAFQ